MLPVNRVMWYFGGGKAKPPRRVPQGFAFTRGLPPRATKTRTPNDESIMTTSSPHVNLLPSVILSSKDQHSDKVDDKQDLQGFQVSTDIQELHGTVFNGLAAGAALEGGKTAKESDEPGGPLLKLLRSNLDLHDYVSGLFDHSDELSDPCYDEHWKSPIIPFTRWVKAYPEVTHMPAKAAWKKVKKCVTEWSCPETDEEYWWQFCFGVSEKEAANQFQLWWDRIRSLPTADPIEFALKLAKQTKFYLSEPLRDQRPDEYGLFVFFCGFLQYHVGAKTPIFIPTQKVGDLFELSFATIARYCKLAIADKFLTKVAESSYSSKGKSLAASYLFDLRRMPTDFKGPRGIE